MGENCVEFLRMGSVKLPKLNKKKLGGGGENWKRGDLFDWS